MYIVFEAHILLCNPWVTSQKAELKKMRSFFPFVLTWKSNKATWKGQQLLPASEKENDKQSCRAYQLPFQRVLTGVHPLPSRFQVRKLKMSQPLEILMMFFLGGYTKTGLGFCQGSSGYFNFVLFSHERKFIELVFTHIRGTSTSPFLYVYILSTSVSQE